MLVVLLTVACYSQDKYTTELNQAKCDAYERCDLLGTLGFDGVDDCVSEYDAWAAADGECLEYDAGNARRCVNGWQDLACDTMAQDHPQACFEVCVDPVEDTAAAE